MRRTADRGGFLFDVAGALASLVRPNPWPWAIGFGVLAWATLSVRLDPVRLAIVVSAACPLDDGRAGGASVARTRVDPGRRRSRRGCLFVNRA